MSVARSVRRRDLVMIMPEFLFKNCDGIDIERRWKIRRVIMCNDLGVNS